MSRYIPTPVCTTHFLRVYPQFASVSLRAMCEVQRGHKYLEDICIRYYPNAIQEAQGTAYHNPVILCTPKIWSVRIYIMKRERKIVVESAIEKSGQNT